MVVNIGNPGFNIISRAGWNAAKPVKYSRHSPQRIVVHHSYQPTIKQFHGADTIRGIQRFHMRDKGWDDIAYHFLISPDGLQVFEGRPVWAVGSHCGGAVPVNVQRNFGNTGSVGICCIGDYDTETPAKAMIDTLIRLIQSLKTTHKIKDDQVFGHCDAWTVPPKTCPGKLLFIELFGKKRYEELLKKH